MATPFLGEIRMAGFGFAPRGWALCAGQTLPINQNQALFSLLGTTFGGDGKTNFLLPDLRGRVPVEVGTQGNSAVAYGQKAGEELHTLVIGEMPTHLHNAVASSGPAAAASPSANFWPTGPQLYAASPLNTPMAAGAITNTGGSQPHENRSPYTVINFIIALAGIFPTQN
jgi:microcystin-dependent protein